jgi:uncharacterized LabA/DUF88 family protein
MATTPAVAHSKPRTIVYIDGFNLYYGAVRDVPALKWLNIEKLCRQLRPNDDLQKIKYFTALIGGPTKPNQEIYLRALATLPTVEVILGRFKEKKYRCGVVACTHTAADRWYSKPEEKRTDVNIAVSMVDDAYQNACDNVVLISGDSDLVAGVATVRSRFSTKKITLYVPARNPLRAAAFELRAAVHRHRELPLIMLPHCQFPDTIPDGSGGTLTRPAAWH